MRTRIAVSTALRSAAAATLLLGLAPTAAAQPMANTISPASGPTAGGIAAEVTGSGFMGAGPPQVYIDGRPAAVTDFDDSSIDVILPAGQGAGLDVRVEVDADSSTLTGAFSYNAPSVAALNPASGPIAGGNTVEIFGSDFGLAPIVTFDGVPAAVFSNSHTSIMTIAPAGAAPGSADVVVTAGAQPSLAAAYTYDPASLVLNSILPATAPTRGGTILTITGGGFGASPTVTIGGVNAPVTDSTSETLSVEVPEGEGTGLSVSVLSGVFQQTLPAAFSYEPPVINGLGDGGGGGELTIFGENFGLNPVVTVGGMNAPLIDIDHDALIVDLPAAAPGSMANVVVIVAGQATAPTPFTYPFLPADLNGDGKVDGADLGILLQMWNP